MSLSGSLLALVLFPGLIYALPMGWLMLASERRTEARLQGRIGPPLAQAFWDFLKLVAKSPVPRAGSDRFLMAFLPLLAAASALGSLALLPAPGRPGGPVGDLILFVSLLELAPLCSVLAGFASRSVYGQVGATREAVLGLAANVPFLAALLALSLAAGSLDLGRVVQASWAVKAPALLAILLCLPAKLRINPFSVPNAEQEILAGPLTEFDGPRLALWELAHALEWVTLTGLVAALLVPAQGLPRLLAGLLFVLVSFALVPLLATVGAATARLKLAQAARFLWRWASLAAAASFIAAFAFHLGRP